VGGFGVSRPLCLKNAFCFIVYVAKISQYALLPQRQMKLKNRGIAMVKASRKRRILEPCSTQERGEVGMVRKKDFF